MTALAHQVQIERPDSGPESIGVFGVVRDAVRSHPEAVGPWSVKGAGPETRFVEAVEGGGWGAGGVDQGNAIGPGKKDADNGSAADIMGAEDGEGVAMATFYDGE